MNPFLHTASRVLAAALSECLPGLQIQDVGELTGGIYCDFSSPLVHDQLLSQIEEHIRQIVRERRAIQTLEMVPFSAAELLKKVGQKHRAAQVLEQEGFVQLIRIGEFADWSEGDHLEQAEGVFKLTECKPFAKNCYRVFGFAAPSKEHLKELIARFKNFPQKDHIAVGDARDLWGQYEGEWVWLAKGLKARREMQEFFLRQFAPLSLEIEGDYRLVKKQTKISSVMQLLPATPLPTQRGLLESDACLQVFSFEKNEASATSLLQTMHKSLTILGFTVRMRLLGRRRKGPLDSALQNLGWEIDLEEPSRERPLMEFLVEDPMQCEWACASLNEEKEMIRLTVWVERNLALLLERSGDLLIAGDKIEN